MMQVKFSRFINIFFLSVLVLGCTSGKKPGVPDNAINPEIIKNPATASSSKEQTKLPVLEFENDTHDFGTITQGEKVSYSYKFKNTGNGDLLIRSAAGSCGCTVPEWSR